MAKTSATGAQGTNLYGLVQLVANSSHFQAVCGAGSAEAAEARVHWPCFEADEVGEIDRPAAVVLINEFAWEKVAGGGQNYLLPRGSLNLLFTDYDRHPGDYQASIVEFLNFVDGTLADIAAKSAEDSRISIVRIEQTVKPMISSPTDSQRPHWLAQYEVAWDPVG